jgi:hypothetical protein
MYEEIMQKIKAVVPDETKAQEMFDLVTEEVFENLFTQLADTHTDEEMKVYETRLNEAKSPEHLQNMIKEVAVTVYGDNYLEQLKNDYIVLIDEIQKNIEDARNLVAKSQQGDTTATDLINKAQQTDIYKSTMENSPS